MAPAEADASKRREFPSVSVIIPAHNEGAVIARALEAVFRQDYPGELQVIVAANGCDDDTVQVSRSYEGTAAQLGRQLRTIDLASQGKPGALNAADALATGEMRIYLDADVTISPSTVTGLVDALETDGILFAVPNLRLGHSKSRIVRDYLAVWIRLPYVRDGGAGGGVFAVSPAGRARWADYPSIYADDTFVRLQFGSSEVALVQNAFVTVWFPATAREMIAVRARLFLGVWELQKKYPKITSGGTGHGRVAMTTIIRSPSLWLSAPSFAIVYAFGWLQARRMVRRGRITWARADSSRVGVRGNSH